MTRDHERGYRVITMIGLLDGEWPLARMLVLGGAVMMSCAGGCASSSQPSSPGPYVKTRSDESGAAGDGRVIDPVDNPTGSSISLAVRAGEMALGSVPYDGFLLPLVSPDGRFIATQTGSPPTWPTVLAEQGAMPPYATSVEIYRIDTRLELLPQDRAAPMRVAQVDGSVVLGRGVDSEGFLVEAPREDGSRWIGKASWETGAIHWLVQGEMINAFAALSPGGRLAWSRRRPDGVNFDLMVRDTTDAEWTVTGSGGDWLMPVWSTLGNGLYALHRQDSRLRICFGQASGAEAFTASLREFLLMSSSDKYAAYQTFIGQGSLDGMAATGSGAATAPQALLLHPGLGRMILWKPMMPKNAAAVLLNARSLAAVLVSAETAIVCLREEVLLQSLRQRDSHITLSPGTWVPRQTPGWSFPYVMLSPAEGRVQVTALKLLPREAPSTSSDAASASR